MLLLSSNIFSVISLFGTVEEIVSITEEEPEEIVATEEVQATETAPIVEQQYIQETTFEAKTKFMAKN